MVLIRLTGDLSIRSPNVNLDRPCRVQFASNTPVSEYQCLSMWSYGHKYLPCCDLTKRLTRLHVVPNQ